MKETEEALLKGNAGSDPEVTSAMARNEQLAKSLEKVFSNLPFTLAYLM